jgi:hypothetical protein
MDIDSNRLKEIEAISLAKGAHEDLREGACVMEAVAYVAGEAWSDQPQCVCPVIATFCRAWNDALPQNKRDELLKPLISRLVGTRASKKIETRRALMAADWLVRVYTPAWLRLAGLKSHADALAAMPEITSMAQVPSMKRQIEAARKDADAACDAACDAARSAAWSSAWSAACDAAWAAASDAACDAARAAAWAAAWSAARSAAWSAAWAAAWAAARSAAWSLAWSAASDAASDAAGDALRPTVESLQASALNLLNRMIEVK